MESFNSPRTYPSDPSQVVQDADMSSPFSIANLNCNELPENDTMSVVMKRKLGGASSPSMPPQKKYKPQSNDGYLTVNGSTNDREMTFGDFDFSLLKANAAPNDQSNVDSDKSVCVRESNSPNSWNYDERSETINKRSESFTDNLDGKEISKDVSKYTIEKSPAHMKECNVSCEIDEDFTDMESKSDFMNISERTTESGRLSTAVKDESQIKTGNDRSSFSTHQEDGQEIKIKDAEACDIQTEFKKEKENKSISGRVINTLRNEIISGSFTGAMTKVAVKQESMSDASNESNSEVKPADEVDSLNAYPHDHTETKPEVKKSRKQHLPKRVPLISPSSKTSTLDKKEINQLRNVIKPEKSRKQNVPKRVFKESDTTGSDLECYYDDRDRSKCSNVDDDYDFDTVEHYLNHGQRPEVNQMCENISDQGRANFESHRTACIESPDMSDVQRGTTADMFGSRTSSIIDSSFDSQHTLPLHFQTAMFSYNSKKLFQYPVVNDLAVEKLLEQNQSNLTENLEVVKKLREIRFNRYRKISIAEKKEIADYAKISGVSSAAHHYGVSKSAVSMWTHMDFTDIEDDKTKRRKNCMVGNKKFEELVIRVKSEKANKFKTLSREDKFEVSRYAKLVGVREMARCLDIALGTVSGWMRQFPYLIKPTNQEETSDHDVSEISDTTIDSNASRSNTDSPANMKEDCLRFSEKAEETCLNIPDSGESKIVSAYSYVEKENEKGFHTEKDNMAKTYFVRDSSCSSEDSSSTDRKVKSKNGNDEKADEIDEMISVTYETPNVDKCFEDAKEMFKDTILEGDSFFEKLFKRVVECRADKYKSLKASEKLEVVRFAKRIGVRRIAKILGLATGTLSGWTTKYQAHLGLTSDFSIDLNQSNSPLLPGLDTSLDTSKNTEDLLNESLASQKNPLSLFMIPPSSSSVLDNPEKAEVTAVKLILKDRFDYLRDKIELARKIKFKNITHDEKIEVVKCTKLAGIRPTARVLNMPIGTLSGWITKYTSNLHPVYQEECDRLGGPSVHRPSQTSYAYGEEQGSQSYLFNLMNSQWPGIQHLSTLYSETGSDSSMNNEHTSNKVDNMYIKTDSNSDSTSSYAYKGVAGNQFEIKPPKLVSNTKQSNNKSDTFDKEAKDIAAEYLQSIYKNFGVA